MDDRASNEPAQQGLPARLTDHERTIEAALKVRTVQSARWPRTAHSLTLLRTPTMARVAGHNIDEAPVLVNGGVTAATMLAVVLVALSKSMAVVCADTRQSTSFFQLLVVSSKLFISY
jgi:hypothetical protein